MALLGHRPLALASAAALRAARFASLAAASRSGPDAPQIARVSYPSALFFAASLSEPFADR